MHKRTIVALIVALAFTTGSMGAGSSVAGSMGAGSRTMAEKDVNLDIARRVSALLRAESMTVVLTRTGDVTRTPAQRSWVSDRFKADAFVSVHNNASSNPAADHAEVYRQIRSDRSAALASGLAGAFGRAFGEPARIKTRRGDHGDYYWQLRMSRAPSVIVESAFLSNPRQARLLATPEHRQRIAGTIADGILAYQRSLGAPAPNLDQPKIRVPTGLLPVPAGVTATAQSRFAVGLRWEGTTTASRYRIYRDGSLIQSLTVASSPTDAVSPRSVSLAFIDRWAAPGQVYQYEIVGARDASPDASLESAPARVTATTPSLTICLDAGHGGADPGAIARL